jgi:LysM repeat protein
VRRSAWRRYAAPATFLAAVTIAVVLVRAGLHSGSSTPASDTVTAPATTQPAGATTVKGSSRTTTGAAGKRFWIVRAGDTFGVISSGTGVPVATIEKLNPKVKSTSLHIGEKIRVK